MNYILFTNPVSGSPIIPKLKRNFPKVVITFFNNIDSWKKILYRILLNKMTVEDRIRFFYKIEFYDYYSLSRNRLENIIKRNNIDIGFIATFKKIIPDEYINLFPKGVFNLHPSLLPNHAGPDPFFWIIFNEDKITGTSCHFATNSIDSGDLIFQTRYEISGKDSLYLYKKYVKDVAFIIPKVLNDYDDLISKRKPITNVIYEKRIPSESELKNIIKNINDLDRINRALRFYNKSIKLNKS